MTDKQSDEPPNDESKKIKGGYDIFGPDRGGGFGERINITRDFDDRMGPRLFSPEKSPTSPQATEQN